MNSEEGWISWELLSPKGTANGEKYFVEIMRDKWDEPCIVIPKDMSPQANIANLYWRPTGIWREACGDPVMPSGLGYQQTNLAHANASNYQGNGWFGAYLTQDAGGQK